MGEMDKGTNGDEGRKMKIYWIVFPTTVHHADQLKYSRPKQQASEWCFGGKAKQHPGRPGIVVADRGTGQSNFPSNRRNTSTGRRSH